ncbi:MULTISPECIES: hypothetical protein [Rhodopseudomonas]|uniref:Uncharacterized protein n=1 Tax=Rhodopseudomonas palustris TaxID=1076 RepID=A0A0D7F4V7_RHOPL|nr:MULTISPECIES: hypothetical protein [Rhodopseudomonas]KIZ48169.1 hypothetical protein OO17_00360 [Rhodopseudomonas palustris]MDF3810177.1 hypothetical protein [Rhodopseudomonas sp. BAL398]WOK16100.1 hypothetical protein RBJ75_18250 [Rhodopseudomonas sp. BAL398]
MPLVLGSGPAGCDLLSLETKLDQSIALDELEIYRRLLAETTDEQQRRKLLVMIACLFEQIELSTGAGIKSIATRMRGADFTRLN